MRKVLSVLMAIFMPISLSGCFGLLGDDSHLLNDNDSNSSRYEFVGDIEMFVDYSLLGYSVNIKGKLKNTSNKEFSYISVTFAIYDKDGNQIETALDNMNYLQPGSTWLFDASIIGWATIYPKSCRLVNVEVR